VEDQTATDTHVLPWGNSVIAGWGNYVIVNPSHWGNNLIADTFDARHKRVVVANTAIARELAGWCWSLAVLDG